MQDNIPDISEYDVIIIGGGPAGLSAAIYAARSELTTLILDKNPQAGALGTADRIENYPGVLQKMKGQELLSLFRNQAERFGAYYVQAQVIGVDLGKEVKEVMTADKTYYGKTVIIATGAMGRKPTVKGEAEFVGRGVSYCATCDAPFFKGKDVAAIGDIEKIHEELDSICKFAQKIYVISPRPGRIDNSRVEVLPGFRIREIFGKDTVEGMKISDIEGMERTLHVSGVFIYLYGNRPVVDFLYNAVEITEEGCIRVDSDMSTSLEGVYAVGDVTCKKIRQIVLAAAEGCTAALSVEKYLNKRKQVKPQWGEGH